MLTVPTTVKESLIHGLGVFATCPVKTGTVVWRWHKVIDTEIWPGALHDLPDHVKRFLNKYAYRNDRNNLCIGTDNDRFINHSETPNVGNGPNNTRVALRDIRIGDELTEDYAANYPQGGFAMTGAFPDGSTPHAA